MRTPDPEVAARVAGRWRQLDRAVFRLSGPDRIRYLNGQVSNDVTKLAGRVLPACLCGLKGKVEALVWIHEKDGALILDGEASQRDYLATRLGRYLIADDCELEDVTEAVEIRHHFDLVPEGLPSWRLAAPGRDCFLWASDAVPEPLSWDPAQELSEEEWALLEILSLTPRSGWEIRGEEFPAELGLDAWAVDFHKGCYLGQEIVSRIRSVGKVKRELVRVLCPQPLAQGTPVVTEDGCAGTLCRATQVDPENRHWALALVSSSPKENNSVDSQRVVRI